MEIKVLARRGVAIRETAGQLGFALRSSATYNNRMPCHIECGSCIRSWRPLLLRFDARNDMATRRHQRETFDCAAAQRVEPGKGKPFSDASTRPHTISISAQQPTDPKG